MNEEKGKKKEWIKPKQRRRKQKKRRKKELVIKLMQSIIF